MTTQEALNILSGSDGNTLTTQEAANRYAGNISDAWFDDIKLVRS
jgi:hypothetical protein